MFRLIIFSLLLFIFSVVNSMPEKNLSITDSLFTLLNNSQNEKSKISIYNQLALEIQHYSTDTALLYLDSSLTLALKYNKQLEEANSYQIKGVIYNNSGRYDEAIDFEKKALLLYMQNKDTVGLISAYSALGVAYSYTCEYSKAINYYTKSHELAEAINDTSYIILMLNNKSFIYNEQKDYDKALSMVLRSIEMKSALPDETSVMMAYVNAGSIYYNIGDMLMARGYLDTAMIVADKYNIVFVKMAILQKLGNIYLKTQEYELSLKHYKSALAMQEEMEDVRGMSFSLKGIGEIYLKKGLYEKADEYFNKSLEIAENNNLPDLLSELYLNFSELYNYTKQYEKSREYLIISYRMKDSILNSDVHGKIAKIEARYQKAKTDNEIIKLETEKKQKENKIIEQKNWMIILAVIVLIVIFFSVLIMLQKRKKDMAYRLLLIKNLETINTPIDQTEEINVDQQISEGNQDDDEVTIQSENETAGQDKYKKSQLTEIQKEELIQGIIKLMEEDKMYVNPDLTIDILASELNIYKKYISQVVNEKFHLNFNNFVNKYRVKETQKLLLDPKNDILSIEGIATTAGFNSKSSFNTAFKKYTGLTPSYFRINARSNK